MNYTYLNIGLSSKSNKLSKTSLHIESNLIIYITNQQCSIILNWICNHSCSYCNIRYEVMLYLPKYLHTCPFIIEGVKIIKSTFGYVSRAIGRTFLSLNVGFQLYKDVWDYTIKAIL